MQSTLNGGSRREISRYQFSSRLRASTLDEEAVPDDTERRVYALNFVFHALGVRNEPIFEDPPRNFLANTTDDLFSSFVLILGSDIGVVYKKMKPEG